ncbi:MAG: glycerol-3-phosphate dehydrogenase [Pseudomonadota bacterium]|jgi:glycerol-3-phosphate dehydrogenase|nr:MAG: glycerol-3-phosphate dehydrogenase [Pseudomonadota bacterium]
MQFDLIIVGGGINGAGIARDATGRGLSVCLVEQDDLAAHTSSASTKLIHGGLRYLEHGELRLVRESLSERERLLAIAPHIVRPMRFVLPYVDGLRPRWLLRLGLFVYDNVGGREKLAASSSTHLAGTPLGAPLRGNLTDGFEYSDCWVEDSRLVVLNAMDAAARGAAVLVRTRLVSATPLPEGWSVRVEDSATGAQRTLHGRMLVNATGAWVNEVLGRAGIEPRQRLRLVKGSHLVLRRLYEGDHAYLLQSPDRRVLFAIPFEDRYTLLGTTDVPFEGDPSRVSIDDAERDYLLAGVNRFLRVPATAADIVWSYAGVRPLYDDGSEPAAQKVSRDYHLELQHGTHGAPVLSVYGGKITTFRRLAEAAMEMVLRELKCRGEPWTAGTPLPGGDIADGDLDAFISRACGRWSALPAGLVQRLARLHGTRMAHILGAARELADLGRHFGALLTEAEVRYLVREEWARSAEDILWRRTRLGLALDASAVQHLQHAVAELLG